MSRISLLPIVMLLYGLASSPLSAQEQKEEQREEKKAPVQEKRIQPMDLDRLHKLILRVDPEAVRQDNQWRLTLREFPLQVIVDPQANRMRAMTPVAKSDQTPKAVLYRMLQADFDAALDARYAIGHGYIWSTFIHPLSSLHSEDFMSALGQVVIAAETFGSTFSSGALVFGGGDSNEEHEKLFRKLEQLADEEQVIY